MNRHFFIRAHSRKILWCLVTAMHCHVSMAHADQSPAILQLSGTDWSIREDADGKGIEQKLYEADTSSPEWAPATVPGNVQGDLEAAHRLKPLWYGVGDSGIEAVSKKDWWYRKDFTIPPSFGGTRLTLVFDGVDQRGEVWFNGKQLGSNTGMFKRFQFDVTAVAKAGMSNQLAVRIAPCPDPKDRRKPSMELKSHTRTGWDWGTPLESLGIWKDVRLETTGPARIDWTRVQTKLNDDRTKSNVIVSLDIDSTVELPVNVRFQVSGHGQTGNATVVARLKPGRNVVEGEVPLENPALWWPNGQGEQPLYALTADLRTAEGTVLDQRSVRFGVRDLQWVHTEGAPADFVSRYQLVVNGRPVRTIGSNLIPADLLFGRMNERAMNLLRHAHAAGMNTLRLWGGGAIFHQPVYDLADELGIMLVQEFPLANFTPPKTDEYLAILDSTARDIVRQVRNHPSIVEFDGGNEMPWNSKTDHPAFHLLKKIVAEEDGRLFRATCPDLGATHGPWFFNLRNDCRGFDGGTSMRAGEFGASSPANLEVWHREIPIRSQWPIVGVDDPALIRKKVVRAVFAEDYWLRKPFLENAFGPFSDLPEIVEGGQWYGAEGLRYAIDAFRRRGRRIGGMTNWDFNEPWPNGAGSYLVDYDGRTMMTYDFFKQAVAPISLSLKYESIFFSPSTGIKTELFLVSDAPSAAKDLRWRWLARDRRGMVFTKGEGTAAIAPLEVKSLGAMMLKPPLKTALGPVFVEMRLEDASGRLLGERLHVFGADKVADALGGLLRNKVPDRDDDGPVDAEPADSVQKSDQSANLAFVGNGAKPATATSSRPEPIHQPAGLNDGRYGNAHSWIAGGTNASFQIDLGKQATVGRFVLSRDRTAECGDRGTERAKIEVSTDGLQWQTVFEMQGIRKYLSLNQALEIVIAPAQARYIRASIGPTDACLDEFEVYAPRPGSVAGSLPHVASVDTSPARKSIHRPVMRTVLKAAVRPGGATAESETLELVVENTGPMTALFCEPHPLISYRTDLFIENNHCFIPPGESRTITICAGKTPKCGLSLAQTGWRISCWNADDVVIEPGNDVLLAVGRRDQMCREFADYFEPAKIAAAKPVILTGARPEPSGLPYRLDRGKAVRFEFSANSNSVNRPARLRIHTADQSKEVCAAVTVTVNGKSFKQTLPAGLGLQNSDPAHLAFPATMELEIPLGLLARENVLEVKVDQGWFTWDSLECVGSLAGNLMTNAVDAKPVVPGGMKVEVAGPAGLAISVEGAAQKKAAEDRGTGHE